MQRAHDIGLYRHEYEHDACVVGMVADLSGVAYVYDETATLNLNCNLDSVDPFPVEEGSADEKTLLALLKEHAARTGSPKAGRLIADWANVRPSFAKVVPSIGKEHSHGN